MQPDDPENAALEHLQSRLQGHAPAGHRIALREETHEWDPAILRQVAQFDFNVLVPRADLVMYFDRTGRLIGWRDDGRKGSEWPNVIDRAAFLDSVVKELGLNKGTRLGTVEPNKLPPLGWTHEGVLFEPGLPHGGNVIRVWAEPDTLRVIQWLRIDSEDGAASVHQE